MFYSAGKYRIVLLGGECVMETRSRVEAERELERRWHEEVVG